MASVTITVPDAAVPYIREVLIDDGWDQANPPTLAAAVQRQIIEYYKKRITELKSRDAQKQIQVAIQTAVDEAHLVLGDV